MPENALAALTQVAAVGAMTLVTAMVADVWREVRERVAALLSRGDRGRESLPRQLLEESRQRIQAAPPQRRPAVRAAEQDRWEAALRLALALDHELALGLAVLADDVATQLGPVTLDGAGTAGGPAPAPTPGTCDAHTATCETWEAHASRTGPEQVWS